MLDLILLPAALVLAMGLRAARRGHFRAHGHLMASGMVLVGIRLALAILAFAAAAWLLWRWA